MSPSQPFRSLQFRLAWRLALVVSAVVLATSFAILLHRRSGMTDIPREELIEAIDQVTAGLSLGSDGKPQLSLPANPEYSYAVAAADGRGLFASARPPGEAPRAGPRASSAKAVRPSPSAGSTARSAKWRFVSASITGRDGWPC